MQPTTPRFSRHRIRILGTVGIAVGLIVAVLGATSTFQSLDSLTGSIVNSEKAQEKAIKDAEKAKRKAEETMKKAEEKARKELEKAQQELEEANKKIEQDLLKRLKDSADLSLTKTAPESITSQENLVYRITISNAGPEATSQIRFTEPFNDTLTFASATVAENGGNVSCKNITNSWVCVLNSITPIAAGESRTIDMAYRTRGANQDPACDKVFVTGPTKVENDAKKPSGPMQDNNEAPTVSTRVDCDDIMADISVNTYANPSTLTPNETMRYTVNVTNNGPNKASRTKFTHHFSDKLTFNSASIQNCTVDEGNHEVTCALGDDEERMQGNLQADETAQVELEFTVSPEARCEFLIAETELVIESDAISATIDPLEDNNKAPISTEVACAEPEAEPQAETEPTVE